MKAKIKCEDPPDSVQFIAEGNEPCGAQCEINTTVQIREVDLDVDSDNNGQINEADDDIENDPLTPQRPGAVLWKNNDDSDGNQASDHTGVDAGAIDGAADLVDAGQLIVRGIDAAWVPVGARLFLETSDYAAVRAFSCYTGNCADPVLGPEFPAAVEIPLSPADRTFAIEGVEDGRSLTIALILTTFEGVEICRDTVRVSVVKLEVKWETLAGQPITEVNTRGPEYPGADIGVKYVPDATEAGGAWNDWVFVVCETTPPVQNATVFFKSLDVDDPAEDNNEVDPGDANQLGGDNRPTLGNLAWQHATDADGKTQDSFLMNHRPGDNHRIAATLKETARNVVTNNNVPPSGQTAGQKNDNEVALFIGDISPLLTIWRGLYLDLDSMAAGRDEAVEDRKLKQTGTETGHSTHSLSAIKDWDGLAKDGSFEGGQITVAGGGTYEIVDNVDDGGDDSLYVNGDVTVDEGKLADFVDDDVALVPRKVDISLLEIRLKQAYIDVTDIPARSTLNLPFISNVEDENTDIDAASAPGRLPDTFQTSPQYWTLQMVACYQGKPDKDRDPDRRYHYWPVTGDYLTGESGTRGITIRSDYTGYDNVCLVFLETIRDYAEWTHEPYSPDTPTTQVNVEITVVTHEVGHAFGISGNPHPPDGIMRTPAIDPQLEFRKADILIIRAGTAIETP